MSSSIEKSPQSTDEEAFLYAMKISSISLLPMTLGAAIHLGILDIVANAGPHAYLSPSEISALLPTRNAEEASGSVDRMLRLLASYNVLTCRLETAGVDGKVVRKYGAAPVVKFFTNNEDGVSLAPYALLCQDKIINETWPYLKYVVLEGTIPFEKAYKKTRYEFQITDPRVGKLFNESMSNSTTIVMKAILQRYRGFDDLNVLIDVGGGVGGALDIILKKHPHIRGVNFDLPHVISEAPVISGVEHIAGDMFDSIPGGGDAIFLKWILHNWSDECCLKILKKCYEALPDNGKVIVMDYCLPVYPESTLAAQESTNLDVLMMLIFSGKERTKEELEFLAKEACFSRVKADCNFANYWIFEFYK